MAAGDPRLAPKAEQAEEQMTDGALVWCALNSADKRGTRRSMNRERIDRRPDARAGKKRCGDMASEYRLHEVNERCSRKFSQYTFFEDLQGY
jgi:hypothetical protein